MKLKQHLLAFLIYRAASIAEAGDVGRRLQHLEQTQFATQEHRERLQAERLQQLINHARKYVPHYNGLTEIASVNHCSPSAILAGIPFLKKADLQRQANAMASSAALGRRISKTTGGSTGEPVTLSKTRTAFAWELAATWRGYGWAGVYAGERQARFWGVPKTVTALWRSRLVDIACNRIRISAFSFTESDLKHYVALIERRRPVYFYGYVSMLAEFARFLERNGITLSYRPTCVITTSEVLTDQDRELLTRIFRARVFNEYGCGELGTVAHECEQGRLHLSEENMFVEVFDGDIPAPRGGAGELVVTELNNLATPLIRYRTGDFGIVASTPCPCGRTLRVLDEIHGRAYDFIRNRNGQLFHGEFMIYLFEDLRRRQVGIRQFQVVQRDLDTFLVRLVTSEQYTGENEAVITDYIRTNIEPEATVGFEYVESIAREKSGKLRVIRGLESS